VPPDLGPEQGPSSANGATERWNRLEPLLDELLGLDASDREARLAALAGEDPELSAAARRLLATAEEGELPARPAAELAALLADGEDLLPSREGERVGPFEITGELGRGGMGTVYAARRVEGGFDQGVAIKVVKGGLDSEEVLRRFLAERRILARLEHPHIARLLDGGATGDGLPWFAMERVDGVPITDHVDRDRLPTRGRLALFLDVCDAVAFAHRSLIVHRDIKPSNVLVRERGGVALLDFGIAKLVGEGEEGLTRTVQRPMTPRYAAPEQLAGAAVSTLTDVWQLGRLLAEMLPPPLPRDLERIVARACHDEPERRYPSVEAFAEDVRRFLDGRPVTARGDSAAYRASRFVRRHRLGVAAAVLVVAALVAGLAVALWQARVARREAERARTVKDFLISTFEEARPEVAKGEETTAREILQRGAARIDRDLAADPALQAEMLEVVGGIEQELGALPRAAALWERALEVHRRAGHPPRSIAAAQLGLAAALTEQAELARAETLAREALRTLSRELGPDSPEALEARVALGAVYRRQTKRGRAELELRAALAGLRAALPPEDERITSALDSLANTIFDQSRYGEAEPLFREILDRAVRAHGAESVAAAQAWNDLGAVLDESDQDAAAEPAYQRSLALMRRLLGNDHPAVARTVKNLGALYDSMGRTEEARRALAESAAIVERTQGPEAYDLMSALNTLAIVDYRLGNYPAAAEGLRRVLAGFRRQLGADHSDTLAVQSNLAAVLGELRQVDEAEQLQRDVIARRRASGDSGGSLSSSVHVLGNVLLRAGRTAEAIATYDEAVALKAEIYGRDSPLYAVSLEAAARARLARGQRPDLERGGSQIRECLEILAHHADASRNVRGDVLVTAGRYDLLRGDAAASQPRLEEALAIRRDANGEGHWKTAEARLHLGRALAMLDKTVDARRELAMAADSLTKNPGREELLGEARRAIASLAPR